MCVFVFLLCLDRAGNAFTTFGFVFRHEVIAVQMMISVVYICVTFLTIGIICFLSRWHRRPLNQIMLVVFLRGYLGFYREMLCSREHGIATASCPSVCL